MSNDTTTIDRQAAQVAMLREALHVGRALTMGYINGALTEKSKDEAIADLQIINAALTATAADVEAWQAARALSTTAAKAWERERRNAVIDECCDAAHDAIHQAIVEVDECEDVKATVNSALESLKETP